MGIIIRQSIKSTFVLYTGIALGVVNRLFFLPSFLTIEQLGLLDVLIILAMLLAKISPFGIQGSITKFFSYFQNNKQLESFMGVVIVIPLIGYALLGSIFYFFQEPIINLFEKDKLLLSQYYIYIFPLAFFIILKETFSVYSINNMRLTVPSILENTFLRLVTLSLLLLVGYNLISFNQYLIGYTLSFFLIILFLAIYCKLNFNFSFNLKLKRISKKDYKRISTYSIFILLAGISNLISQYTDSIMLASLEGFDATGIYSIAFFLGISIEMPKRAITTITGSLIAKHWNDGNRDEISKLYKQSSINQGIIGAFLFILIVINLDEIFSVLPKSEILSAGKNVAIIIGLSRVIDMFTGVNNEILRTSKHYKIDFFVLLFFIGLSVLTNYILIPILGLNGAAISTLISVFLYNFIRYLLLKRLFQFDPFSINTLKLLIITGVLIGLFYLLPTIQTSSLVESIIAIAIKTIIFGGIFIIVISKLKISKEVNELLNKILRR